MARPALKLKRVNTPVSYSAAGVAEVEHITRRALDLADVSSVAGSPNAESPRS